MSETTVTSVTESPSPRSRRRRRGLGAVIVLTAVLGIAGAAGAHHTGFPDVPSGAYFHEPVGWAAGNGITDGYGETGLFRPELEVTRGEVVTFLHRNHKAFNPTQTLAAQVNITPTGIPQLPYQTSLGHHVGGAGTNAVASGVYIVAFDRDIGGCWYQATPLSTAARTATVSQHNNTHALQVRVRDENGAASNSAVHVTVTCPNAS
jgi:hypothetical protein